MKQQSKLASGGSSYYMMLGSGVATSVKLGIVLEIVEGTLLGYQTNINS